MHPLQLTAVLLFTSSLGLTGAANAATAIIDFDDLASGVPVTTQYPEVTFSSDAGFENRTASDFNLGTSLPNYICTAEVGGTLSCTNTTRLVFTTSVSNLTFYAAGDDDAGVTGQVDVYENGVFSATVDVVTDGVFEAPHLVDLSAFVDVTEIVIRNITNGGGLAWDDFVFDTAPTPVEEVGWGELKSLYR